MVRLWVNELGASKTPTFKHDVLWRHVVAAYRSDFVDSLSMPAVSSPCCPMALEYNPIAAPEMPVGSG